jgi:hypothetical protein
VSQARLDEGLDPRIPSSEEKTLRRHGPSKESVCRVLGVSASAYYQRAAGRRSVRAVEDERLLGVIRELHKANSYVYGYRQTSKAPQRARAGRP